MTLSHLRPREAVMPYLDEEAIKRLNLTEAPRNSEELNYVLTMTVIRYIEKIGTSYQSLGDVISALERVKQEFYRRRIEPYENKLIQRHGDIY